MTITRRTLAIISVAMLVVVLFIYIIISRLFMSSILSFEKQGLEHTVVQAANAIAFDIMTLDKFTSDWAVWTETAEFVQQKEPAASEYPDEYLTDSAIAAQGLNVILYINEQGELVRGKWYDLEQGHEETVSDATSALLYRDPLLLSTSQPYESVKGLVNMPAGPMMVVSQPIYNSNAQGPVRGHLIVGRYLDAMEWESLNQVIHMPASLEPADFDGTTGIMDVFDTRESRDIGIEVEAYGDTAFGAAFIRDIHGTPAFRLEVQKNRVIYSEGMASAALISGSLGLTALLVFLVMFVLIKRQVLDRVVALTNRIGEVNSLEALPVLEDEGADEISALTFHIRKMLTQLKDSQDEFQYINSHDPLTGVQNRSSYERYVMEADDREGRSRGVIVCDIDGLKLANDLVGHEYGDELLCKVSAALKDVCPADAMIARMGGDEFVMVLSDGRESYLNELCSRIQSAMEAQSADEQALVSFSVSLGFAGCENASVLLKDLVRKAEKLMYREKLHRSQSGSSSLVSTLRGALGARDYLTEGHASRMRELSLKLAQRMRLAPQRIPDLLLFTEFHDVGKIGVPDSILFKPGPLDVSERAKMQRHCEIGHQIAMTTKELSPIADFILKHHEWWNGQGYPQGLQGELIPLECRILAVVDAWDAMTNDRPYRQAMTVASSITELRRGAGSQFDPEVVDKFVSIIEIEAASA